MFRDFNAEYPRMRPLAREVYGKLIFVSGAENDSLRWQIHEGGIRDIRVSYFYLRRLKPAAVRKSLDKFENVILDAGGYEYISQAKGKKPPTLEEIRYYTQEYSEFILKLAGDKDTKGCFNWVFECDLASGISEEFRWAHINELRDNGIRILPVLRVGHDLKPYLKHPFVALHPEWNETVQPTLRATIDQLKSNHILIHAQGAADEGSINRQPYFSVDSPGALYGAKYGVTYVFDQHKLNVYNADHKEDIRNKYRYKFIAAGLEIDQIMADEASAVNTMNAYAWKEYTDYAALNISHSYWLSGKEIAQAKELQIEKFGINTLPDAVEQYTEAERQADMIRATDLQSILPEGMSPYMDPRGVIPRRCNTCALKPMGDGSNACPAYKENANCHFATTINVRTLEDMQGLIGAVASMQMSRISHGMMVESALGGALDSSLSKEIKTATAIAKVFTDMVKVDRTVPTGGGKPKTPSPDTQKKVKNIFEDDDEEFETIEAQEAGSVQGQPTSPGPAAESSVKNWPGQDAFR